MSTAAPTLHHDPRTPLGDAAVDELLKTLGFVNTPALVRSRVAMAGGFFAYHRFPITSISNYLRGIDLSKDVKVVEFSPGTIITQHYDTSTLAGTFRGSLSAPRADLPPSALGLRLGLWFSKSGVSSQNLGISQGTRQVIKLRLIKPAWVLESTAAHTVDSWTWGRSANRRVATGSPGNRVLSGGEYASGGGVQYVLPNAANYVLVVGRR